MLHGLRERLSKLLFVRNKGEWRKLEDRRFAEFEGVWGRSGERLRYAEFFWCYVLLDHSDWQSCCRKFSWFIKNTSWFMFMTWWDQLWLEYKTASTRRQFWCRCKCVSSCVLPKDAPSVHTMHLADFEGSMDHQLLAACLLSIFSSMHATRCAKISCWVAWKMQGKTASCWRTL